MKNNLISNLLLIFALFLLAACSPAAAEPVIEATTSPVPATPASLPEATPVPTAAPAATLVPSPTALPTALPDQDPTPTTVVHPQNGWKGWQSYRNAGLGFSFQYPPEWGTKPGVGTMTGHSIILVPNTTSLAQMVVAYKATSEDRFIGRTGLGGGELVSWGRVLCLGKETERQVLVSDGKHMTVLYPNLVRGDLTLNIAVDYLGNWSDPTGIPADVEANADSIVASLAYERPFPAVLTAQDDGLQIQLKTGEPLTVTLEGNLTTGYSWLLDPSLKALWQPVGEPAAVPANDLLGAPAMISLQFQAVQPGVTPLKLVYARSWEKDAKPDKTFEATVVVK